MPTFNSNIATAFATKKVSTGIRNGDDANGKLTVATANVTIPSTLAANDILNIIPAGLLPIGAVVVPQLSSVTSADPGTTLTLDIGFAANPDAYADGITLSAGGQIAFTSGTLPDAVTTPVRIENATGAIYATVMSAAAITNATVLTFVIAYRSK
jgi:hypothetical protein